MIRLILFLLLIPCSLGAAYFESNPIGQMLQPKDGLDGEGWEGESEDGRTVIYEDGVIMRERVETDSGYTITEPGRTEEIVLGEGGRRISRTVTEDGTETSYTYFYDDGMLSSVSISENGELVRRIVYLNTPSGTLAGLSGDTQGFILPSYYVYESDGRAIQAAETSASWVPPVGYTLLEDGSWREETEVDGRSVVRIYSPDGRLISTEGSGVREEYRYREDGTLSSSIERRGNVSLVTEYDERGDTIAEYRYAGPVMETERHYLPSGEIEEIRYRDGVRRNRILFDSDGLRVKEVENYR